MRGRHLDVGFGHVHGRLDLHVLQREQQLAFLYEIAFVDMLLVDERRDFGADGNVFIADDNATVRFGQRAAFGIYGLDRSLHRFVVVGRGTVFTRYEKERKQEQSCVYIGLAC